MSQLNIRSELNNFVRNYRPGLYSKGLLTTHMDIITDIVNKMKGWKIDNICQSSKLCLLFGIKYECKNIRKKNDIFCGCCLQGKNERLNFIHVDGVYHFPITTYISLFGQYAHYKNNHSCKWGVTHCDKIAVSIYGTWKTCEEHTCYLCFDNVKKYDINKKAGFELLKIRWLRDSILTPIVKENVQLIAKYVIGEKPNIKCEDKMHAYAH